jgi:hypothetical protein
LFDLIEIAEARTESRLVQRWERHTVDSWQAAQTFLARRFVNQWGDKRILELTMQELSQMSPEKLAELVGPDAIEWLSQQAQAANIVDVPMLREEDFQDAMDVTLDDGPS